MNEAVANLLQVGELGRGNRDTDPLAVCLDDLFLLVTSNTGHVWKGQARPTAKNCGYPVTTLYRSLGRGSSRDNISLLNWFCYKNIGDST